jgi:hypothetical protein
MLPKSASVAILSVVDLRPGQSGPMADCGAMRTSWVGVKSRALCWSFMAF